jgi:uncharacterized membrane protein
MQQGEQETGPLFMRSTVTSLYHNKIERNLMKYDFVHNTVNVVTTVNQQTIEEHADIAQYCVMQICSCIYNCTNVT